VECPWAKWFVGGEINLSYNCLDRHVQTWRKNKAAIIWESEPGEVRTLTYQQLHREVPEVRQRAEVAGVKKGDRVAIYMGMTPELAIAMLACARIGAPHTVGVWRILVKRFGGSHSRLASLRRYHAGRVVPSRRRSQLFPAVEEALKSCPSVKNVIVYKRTGSAINMQAGRDHWWHELMAEALMFVQPSRSTRSILCTSSIRRELPANQKDSCTPPAATRSELYHQQMDFRSER